MYRTDEDIKKDVFDQLFWDSRIDAAKVTVEVRNGVVTLSGGVRTPFALRAAVDGTRIDVIVKNGSVTLSGSVSSWAERQTSYDAALFTQGATSIHDELVVRPEGP